MKRLLFITSLLILIACSFDGTPILKLGEKTSGDRNCFAQEITELNYAPSNSDSNSVTIELRYNLYSYFDSIKALGGYHNYQISVDNNRVTNQTLSNYPTSIAPNESVSISFSFVAFKDWKVATITYDYQNTGDKYSFSIKRDEYDYPINNMYPTLSPGDSCTNKDNTLIITLNSIYKTTVGSSGLAENQDNIAVSFALTSTSDSQLQFPAFYACSIKADNGFTSYSRSGASPDLPNSISARSSVTALWILVVENNWDTLVFRIGDLFTVNVNNPFK